MRFSIKFNWVLQTTVPKTLQPSQRYPFDKKGNRIFPLNKPIDLIDFRRNAVAKIKIICFENTHNHTTGVFEFVKIYADEKKAILTNYWIENE